MDDVLCCPICGNRGFELRHPRHNIDIDIDQKVNPVPDMEPDLDLDDIDPVAEHEHKIQPGDFVRLKSGGPTMTVGLINVDYLLSESQVKTHARPFTTGIYCLWFTLENEGEPALRDAIFPAASLMVVS